MQSVVCLTSQWADPYRWCSLAGQNSGFRQSHWLFHICNQYAGDGSTDDDDEPDDICDDGNYTDGSVRSARFETF